MVTLVDGDGRRVRFTRKEDGTYFAPSGARSTLTKNLDDTFTLVLRDQTTLSFDASGRLASIVDKNANQVTLSYADGRLASVTDALGKVTTFGYDVFGGLKSSSGSLVNDFRFTGEQSDAETGLYCLQMIAPWYGNLPGRRGTSPLPTFGTRFQSVLASLPAGWFGRAD